MKISPPIVTRLKYEKDMKRKDKEIEYLSKKVDRLENGTELFIYKNQQREFAKKKNQEIEYKEKLLNEQYKEIKVYREKLGYKYEEIERLSSELTDRNKEIKKLKSYIFELEVNKDGILDENKQLRRFKIILKEKLEVMTLELEDRTSEDIKLLENKMNTTKSKRVKNKCKSEIKRLKKRYIELSVQA